jgi:hypothetical protein
MQHANEKKRKVRRFPAVLIANLKEGVLLNCLAFRDIDEDLIVPSWPFNISLDEINCPEEASEND